MYPLDYIDPVYRPPSEAQSLILQITNGCSWNKCSFCEMYTDAQKRFRPQAVDQIEHQLRSLSEANYPVRRIFLADGDAMALSTRRLKEILLLINHYYPKVQRVSSYCLPRNLSKKSVSELSELKQLGLSLMYVGCESGDDQVLALVDKGETFATSLSALTKIKQAGMKSSVMILNGLGGMKYSQQHAINSARLMNAAQPNYLSTLVVSFPLGDDRFKQRFNGDFVPLQQRNLFQEMKTLLSELTLKNTIFRSDHASNYLILKGILGRDKNALLAQVDRALEDQIHLRQEWQRGF